MRKRILITLWTMVPVLLLAYHYGPGQIGIARDRSADWILQAQAAEKAGQWKEAIEAYDAALAALPEAQNASERYRFQLAKANARIWLGELPEAMKDMEELLAQMQKQSAEPGQIQDVRASLATAQYYAGWLMRLEGAPKEEWTIEVDQARQNFRLLAEETSPANAKSRDVYQKNLEAVIRLARMDLSELQALPLPKQCEGCKNCSQKCRSQRASKNPEPKEQKEDVDARGASVGKRPEGTGS